jgi:serine/threonine protein kinase
VKEIVAYNIPGGCNGTNGTSEVWDTEASALTQLSDVVHDNLIQCIAAIDKTDRYYFLFPWADGGSLRDFWDNTPCPVLSAGFVRAVITQFDGMAQALRELHDFRGKRSPYRLGEADDLDDGGGIRHGDLKPENILRFVGENDIGILKIADMGLAKHHLKNTRLRQKVTSTKYGTTRYEPPEVEHSLNALSRLYDIWSMGCITLELLIWLLRGNDELVKFDELLDPAKPGRPFYFIKETGGMKEAAIRDEVNAYIGMLEEDPRCEKGTALGDLLDVVKNKLLVISLPDIPDVLAKDSRTIIITPSPQAKPGPKHYRVTARALCTSLAAILDHTDDDYFDAAQSRPLSVPHIVLSAGSDSETASSRRGSRADLHPDAAYDIASRPKDGLGLNLPRVAAQLPVTATQMRGNVSDAFWIRSLGTCFEYRR